MRRPENLPSRPRVISPSGGPALIVGLVAWSDGGLA
jgi:hypothetical protein